MTTESIITLFLAVVALSLKPGPGMTMVMSHTITQGMAGCLSFVAGWLVVLFGFLVFVFFSYNFISLDIVFILILVKTLAAAYLIWLGVKGLLKNEVKSGSDFVKEEGLFNSFTSAVVLTASNPLAIVFYAGILPSLVDVQSITLNDMALITMIVLGVEGILPIIYCAPLALYRKKVPENFLEGLRIFSSVMMILVGLYIGYNAILAEDLLSVF
jgi:threonine/homoserine/homoserine lactone efflux protein